MFLPTDNLVLKNQNKDGMCEKILSSNSLKAKLEITKIGDVAL